MSRHQLLSQQSLFSITLRPNKMWSASSLIVIAAAATSMACVLPPGTLPNSIPEGFAIQVQNASYPAIHNRLLNQWSAGGGDQHLYLSPAGNATSTLTLVNGVITQLSNGQTIRAVINGEVSEPRSFYPICSSWQKCPV